MPSGLRASLLLHLKHPLNPKLTPWTSQTPQTLNSKHLIQLDVQAFQDEYVQKKILQTGTTLNINAEKQ